MPALTVPTVGTGDDTLASWAAAVKAAVDDLYTVQTDTSIGTVATNFTLSSAIARTTLGGKQVYVRLAVISTNAITATGGNITDTLVFTVDAAYRPTEVMNAAAGTGGVSGEATLDSSGLVHIRAFSDSVGAGDTIRMTFSFMQA